MTTSFPWKWEKNYLTSPVTSTEFLGSDLLFSGNGPYLELHSTTNGTLLDNKNVLPKSRIHGIRVEEKHKNLVVIFGQKVIRIVRLEGNDKSISAATDVIDLPDLIWDAHWLYDKRDVPMHVAIATAHNAVWCWEWQKNKKRLIAQCEESCILYSAKFFGSYLDNLFLASGTVFNQILLWKVQGKKDEHNKTSVVQRLTGHEGVIFAINFNKQGTLLSSVSDDRSIRLWTISNMQTFDSNGLVELQTVLYGHSARVWDAKLLKSGFVSIGEDLVCNVWDYEGNIVKVYKGHTGRNIWSLAVNQTEDLIATGGGDGSIRLWPLCSPDVGSRKAAKEVCLPSLNNSNRSKSSPLNSKKDDYPRFVCLLDQTNLLVMTNEGCLYKFGWLMNANVTVEQDDSCSTANNALNLKDHWTLLLKDAAYSSYSVFALSPCHKIIAFGNLQGKIKLQDTDFHHPCKELDAYSGKVHNLLWSSNQDFTRRHLFSCGPDGQITWWNILVCHDRDPVFEVSALCSFVLPPSKQRWASAVVVLPNPYTEQSVGEDVWTVKSFVVVCGDRKGSLHLFHPENGDLPSEKPIAPTHSLPLIHGKAGVSHLCCQNNAIYSAGRDGMYRQLRIHSNKLEVVDSKKVFKGFDWVERLLFTKSGDLIIAGFHAAYFVLWSVRRNEILWRVKCGGAHRVWDLALEHSNMSVSGALLSFIKDSTIHIHKISFPSDVRKALLKPPFHGREATCICYIDTIVGQEGGITDVFATGSEDTNIKLMLSNRITGVVSEVFTAHGHISSVRALNVAERPLEYASPCRGNSKNGGYLLFSGGGRASLRCWRVDLSVIDVNSDDFHGEKATCCPIVFLGEYSFHFSNHRRRRKKSDLLSLSEIRFMSVTSLNASKLKSQSSCEQLIDRCQSLYFVMAACSDGFVRVFAFDEQENKFFLLAQSKYVGRCVLTVNHLTVLASSGPLVILFAGDTAGRIYCWDITALLLNYVMDRYNFKCNDPDVIKSTVAEGKAFLQSNEHSVCQDGGVSLMFDMASEKTTSFCAGNNLMANDSMKGNIFQSSWTQHTFVSHDTACKESNAEINQKTKDENEDGVQCGGHVLLNETFEESKRGSLKDSNDEMLITLFEKQSGHSCLPLVGFFLGLPIHVFQAHQSGINALSLLKTEVPRQYLMVSGGDDSALHAVEFSFILDNDIIKVDVTREASCASAHTSSVTGVKILTNGLIVSSSVDQRIAVWELVSDKQVSSSALSFRQCTVEMVDVADVQDLEVWGESDANIVAAVSGVGLQTLHLVTDV
ncbi:tRNA (34-2'-O)-methyltransferase regulator WDR6-like isoform X1 [Montipora foliosa]|uniref:tRNA (34-2'-O)-methyltransferase regulator WDR6-like isoform X1 n=2 Tax=Montipora foliosa TaxID=591990 RepID=UPI0035F1DEF1